MKHTHLVRHENVLIWIKDCNDLSVLPMASAIQAYVRDAFRKHEGFASQRRLKSNFSLTLDLATTQEIVDRYGWFFEILIPHLGRIVVIEETTQLAPSCGAKYDCIFDLNEQTARNIGCITHRPLVQSFGIMLGAEATTFPESIENLCQEYSPADTVLLSPAIDNVLTFQNCKAELLSKVSDPVRIEKDAPLQERIRAVFEAKAVIAETSFETYLASCLKKPVLELNTDSALNKWDNPNYFPMVILNKESFGKGLSLCLARADS